MPVTVKRGDTLSRIARDAGVSLQELIAANPEIRNPNLIHPGQVIKLPADGTAAPADTSQQRITTPEQAAAEQAQPAAAQPSGQAADPLSELAARFPTARTLYALSDELAAILDRAAREDWAPDLIESNLRATTWWRTRNESQRQFDIRERTDPAQVQTELGQVSAQLEAQAATLGLVGVDVSAVAREVVRSGLSAQQTIDRLLQGGPRRPTIRDASGRITDPGFQGGVQTTGTGTLDVIIDGLGDVAAAYLVDVAPDVIEQWSRNIVSGRADPEGFRLWAEEQAISAYGNNQSLRRALDAGQTVEEWASPYRQLAAAELELPSAAIDLRDPKFRDSILADGLSLSEWRSKVRTDQRFGWTNTRAAQDQAFGLVNDLASEFGLTAG